MISPTIQAASFWERRNLSRLELNQERANMEVNSRMVIGIQSTIFQLTTLLLNSMLPFRAGRCGDINETRKENLVG